MKTTQMINFLYNNYNLKTKLLIFRTDIDTNEKVKTIGDLLSKHPNILKWTLDLEDIDNVLKIKVSKYFDENDVINLIKTQGFYCNELEG